ncbi:MAG TPA: amidohydrolase family protein [Candidatus Angelobacter sp.]|nr:amidohydrolase family protein [Candidatus Angelobacter sp.]
MTYWRAGLLVMLSALSHAQNADKPIIEKGTLTLHLLLHPIGEESYEVVRGPENVLVMNTSFEYSDRGRKRTVSATLRMKPDFSPLGMEVQSKNSPNSITVNSVEIRSATAMVREDESTREITLPPSYFVGFGYTPASVQMMMMRYWRSHAQPSNLPILRANSAADASPAQIRLAGHDVLKVNGTSIPLARYTIANIVFGREILWLNQKGELAAAMNFAGGLPLEAVRKEYEPALSQLTASGVAQELRNLRELQRLVPAEMTGSFAIAGATLVDGTGHPPVADSVVIIRNGRIAAAGPRDQVAIPHSMKVVNASGQTLLPGLWEMHTHYSGIEFGPALLAAGITTARDCGGEFEFLTAIRDEIDQNHGLGPRLLLAGLVDASGPDAFGAVSADTPEEGRAVVARYKAAGFRQVKLYTLLKPEVVKAISEEAHRLDMTVTGHVPSALNAITGVEAGMDQINHLGFVTPVLRAPSESKNDRSDAPIDLNSERVHKAIQFFQEHHTVVDPTASWGEMAGHSKDVEISSFEPAIAKVPYAVAAKYLTLGSPTSESERFHARMAESRAVIGALHKAGIPIVAGSDTGLVGYGLHRELELYVQAGMTPLEAIQTATTVAARSMNLAEDSGSIEPGKRADLILVNGNPLENISNIRKVARVVTNGRMYDSAKLWQSVGFRP